MNYGRYHIIEELGKGAMGVIYKAHDPQIDRVVALKVLRHDRLTSENFIQRFLKEAKVIGRLSHPNIVAVYDVGQDHDTIYIAMEFLEGNPLNELIKQESLDIEDAVNLCIQVAEALDYAHRQRIVHRDIKPGNIILTPNGQAKITDFGIARVEDPATTQLTQSGEILGTPAYMSPEQVMGRKSDGRSDLYSLGVILYELTTGIRPFRANNMTAIFRAITQNTPVDPARINCSISQELSQLIMKSLDKNLNKRFQRGEFMAEALRTCIQEEKPTGVRQHSEKEKSRRIPLLVFIVCIVMAVAGGLSYYLITEKNSIDDPTTKTKTVVSSLLKVDSSPSGAQIFVNGSFRGRTPMELKVPSGK